MRKIIFGIAILITIFFFGFFVPRRITIEGLKGFMANPSTFIFQGEIKKNFQSSSFLKDFLDLKNDFILNKMSFLEINLEKMQVKVYQNGRVIKEVPILAKGDPYSWGGTASGIYKVLSKNELSFSRSEEVYMPYAIHFYGKYFIHGEPYDPNGKKIISSISGGCIRLLNKDAKEIYSLVKKEMPALVIDKESDGYTHFLMKKVQPPEVSARSYLVADLDSGFILAANNSEKILPIASLAKLITAIVVAENVSLKKSILVKPEMLQGYGSTKGLIAGKKFRVVELFYPLLIESSNDATEVLSAFLGRERTIQLMNEKAKAIFMENTNFVDPSGFELGNVSSAKDLFYLARYLINNRPPLLKISRGERVLSFGEPQFEIKDLFNKNVFFQDPSFVGGKTGYLIEAQNTGLFIFQFLTKDGKKRNLVFILLGSEGLKADTQRLYQWIQENYSLFPVLPR